MIAIGRIRKGVNRMVAIKAVNQSNKYFENNFILDILLMLSTNFEERSFCAFSS
jgi:hypothetical protein